MTPERNNRLGRQFAGGGKDGRVPPPPTITPLLVAELLVEGERWPVCVHVIDHPDARVLVDTGMTELRPEVADMDPRLVPLSEQAFDLAGVDVVVNTHLTLTTAAATTRSPDGRFTFSGRSSRTRARRTTTRSASGSTRLACATSRSTASSSCCPGSASSRRRATRAACRWSSSRRAGVR